MKKKILVILIALTLVVSLSGCREADRVSSNISLEADNFGVVRRLSVISAVDNKPVFELIGAFSFKEEGHRITATVKVANDEYKKHTVGLSELTFWVVEDLEGLDVNNYKYEVNFTPKMIQPLDIRYKK